MSCKFFLIFTIADLICNRLFHTDSLHCKVFLSGLTDLLFHRLLIEAIAVVIDGVVAEVEIPTGVGWAEIAQIQIGTIFCIELVETLSPERCGRRPDRRIA